MAEGAALRIKKFSDNNHYINGLDAAYFSIYFSLQDKFNENITLEFKPGVFLGGDFFTGFEVGLFLRYNFPSNNIYVFSGINLHNNEGEGHGLTWYVEANKKMFTHLGIGFGVKMSETVNFIFSYYNSLDNDYGKIIFEDKIYPTELNGIFKAGLEFYIL